MDPADLAYQYRVVAVPAIMDRVLGVVRNLP
jgi:hypothetical protein